MRKNLYATLIITLVMVMSLLNGCGGGGGDGSKSTPPAAPTGLTAIFSSGNIDLSWTSSTSSGITGYNIYRSDNYGYIYQKINTALNSGATYQDTPATNGMYYYQVTAISANGESARSNIAKNAIGTRLSGDKPTGLDMNNGVYVVDSTLTLGSNWNIRDTAKVFVLDGATIDILAGCGVNIMALFRVEASITNPAIFTSHKTGGLVDTEGFFLWFWDSSTDYNNTTGEGCIIENATLTNMRGANFSIRIDASAPKIINSKLISNTTNGTGYISIYQNSGPIIQNCHFEKNNLWFDGGGFNSSLKIDHNSFSLGYYAIAFTNNATINTGQIEYNNFDCQGTMGSLYIFNHTGNGNIPMSNNYWHGGPGNPPLPTVDNQTSWTVNLTPALNSPVTAGPIGW